MGKVCRTQDGSHECCTVPVHSGKHSIGFFHSCKDEAECSHPWHQTGSARCLPVPVVFFPEGTTSDGRNVRRIHGKLLQAAMDTQVPIQPIVICYVDEHGNFDESIPYYGNMNMLQSVKRVLDNRPAKAYVLPLQPIIPGDKTRSHLTELLQQRMSDGLARLQQKVISQQQS